MMRLPRMINNHVLVRIPKETHKGGIAMPHEYVEYNIAAAGVVAAVGPDCKFVSVEDFAFYKNTVGHRIEDDSLPSDSHFIVVSENDLIGYYKKTDAIAHA